MGLVASVGKNNDELVDNLVKHDSIKNERVERIMRLVDRGKFMPENAVEENAYKDSAWKSDLGLPGFLHISAPCIYANVLEHLDLQKGQSFLNIGSGTGYLSTMAGFFLEENGINHGVELYGNVADYAAERISLFQSSPEACAFEWCSPTYFVGNAFQLEQNTNKYDRIYCGALVPESHRAYFCSFLKEEGILVMPYGHSLQRVIRKSEKLFKTRDLSAVTFSHLIPVNIDDNSLSNGHVSLPLIQPTSLQFLCRNKIRQLIRQKLLVDKPVEIFSLYAKKHAKKASSVQHDDDGRNQWNPSRDDLFPPRPMVLDPHLPQPLPLRTRFTSVGTNTHGDPDNNNRAANNNGRHNNNHRQMLANLRHTHATQFRHLFALFARDRIRRHHEAIAHHRAARRDVHIINNANDSDNDDENDDVENEQLEIELRGNERQQRFYSGPDDEAFNFVFESEDEVNNEDDDEHEEEEEEEEGEEEEEENVENDNDSIENYENVDRTDNEDDENNEAVNSDDADSWSDKNNVGSLSSSESYVNLNNDKNDDSYKTAKMTTTTPKKKAKTKSKKCKNKLARLGLELSSDDEEEEEKEDEEGEKNEKEEEEKDEEEKEDGEGKQNEEEEEKEEEGEKEEVEGEKNEEDGDNSNESFETAKDIIMIKDKNFEAFKRYASKMSKNSDDKDGEDKIEEELNKEDGWEESSRGYRFPHSDDDEEDKFKEEVTEEDDGWEETYRRYCLSKMSDDNEEDKIEEDVGRKEDYRRYCLSKMCKNSGNEKNKIEEDDDNEMENDEEKLEEDKEKLNNSMNSSPIKNGNCNNKRLRTCTSNSLEMPQSSKMKRVLSYIEDQQQEEGEHGGVAGPSTSWPTQYLHQRPAPYLHKKQAPISNNTTREEEENVAEAKFNETKVKERTEQLANFHAKFIELIQSLPLNIQMRKFLVYENA